MRLGRALVDRVPPGSLVADHVQVVVERFERRLRRAVGELDRRDHLTLEPLAKLLEVLLGDQLIGEEPVAEHLHGILLAPLLHLLLGSVDLGVSGGVPAEAVREGLDQGRLTLLPGDPDVLGHRLAHREDVHPVGSHAGDAQALGLP